MGDLKLADNSNGHLDLMGTAPDRECLEDCFLLFPAEFILKLQIHKEELKNDKE